MGATLTYYYHLVEPGTFMYHCHVEATEHMQMGMLGNLYVRRGPGRTVRSGTCAAGTETCTQFAYNDGDGSTGYDVEYALQLGGFDPDSTTQLERPAAALRAHVGPLPDDQRPRLPGHHQCRAPLAGSRWRTAASCPRRSRR